MHLGKDQIRQVLDGRAPLAVVHSAVLHLPSCHRCWISAAETFGEVDPAALRTPRREIAALVALLREQERQTLARNEAFGRWVGLRGLTLRSAERTLQKTPTLRDLNVAYAALKEAESAAGVREAEHAALVAELLLAYLEETGRDRRELAVLHGRALIVRGNCRRRAADWNTSASLLAQARAIDGLDTLTLIRWHSISASLALDVGNLEESLRLLAAGQLLIREEQVHDEELGKLQVQAAAAYLASGRPLDALFEAEQAEVRVTPKDSGLMLLLRFITSDSQLALGRISIAQRILEFALHEYPGALPPAMEMTKAQLQARILDHSGFVREADKLFREAAEGFAGLGLHRNSALVRVAMFECAWKRTHWNKAVTICQETIQYLASVDVHPQLALSWRNLLDYARSKAVSESAIEAIRTSHWRFWNKVASA